MRRASRGRLIGAFIGIIIFLGWQNLTRDYSTFIRTYENETWRKREGGRESVPWTVEERDLFLHYLRQFLAGDNLHISTLRRIMEKVPPSTYFVWSLLEEDIIKNSTFLENHDTDYFLWIKYLFSLLDYKRLQKSVSVPAPSEQLKHIVNIYRKHASDPSLNPPIRVVVFGGSVTAGHGCMANPVGLAGKNEKVPDLECAWPYRLETILNGLLGLDAFEIINMAMGGTTSDIGLLVPEYGLWPNYATSVSYPNASQAPDVIIWAHGANDNVQLPSQETKLDYLQEFITTAQQSRCDSLPFIILIDDVFSGEKDTNVHQGSRESSIIRQLASWNGLMSVSLPDAMRDYYFIDVNASLFNQHGHQFNIHPPMAFHILLAWLLLYNIMENFFQMLEMERNQIIETQEPKFFRSDAGEIKFDVIRLPDTQIPPLTSNLIVKDVPDLWGKQLILPDLKKSTCSLSHCEFVWVSCRVCGTDTAEKIHNFLQTVETHNEGWRAEGYPIKQPRAGWVATQPNASFGILLTKIDVPIKSMKILAMKSYDEKWMDSKIKLSLQVIRSTNETDSPLSIFEIEGYHEERTSVILKHKFQLAEDNYPVAGDSLKVDVTLIGGSTFKITGMAFCNR